MVDGRRKGQKFMLDTCRTLSAWWFGLPHDMHFTRLPLRPKSTIAAPLEGWERKADLVVDPRYARDWPFAVECKNDERWKELEKLFEAPKYPLFDWWRQCVEQAATWESAVPLLIFSRRLRRTYVLSTCEVLAKLKTRRWAGPALTISRPGEAPLELVRLNDLVQAGRPNRNPFPEPRKR